MFMHLKTEHQYVRQRLKELQGKTDEFTTIIGDFNLSLLVMDRSRRQKLRQDVIQANSNINQLDLIDIYRTIHPTTAEYTCFLSSHEPFTKTDHYLGHYNLKAYNSYKLCSMITVKLSYNSTSQRQPENFKIPGDLTSCL